MNIILGTNWYWCFYHFDFQDYRTLIKQAAKTISGKAAKENLVGSYYDKDPLGGHYATERSDNIQNDDIQSRQDGEYLPTCPSSCRCECPPVVYVDKTAKLPIKSHLVKSFNDTSRSNELWYLVARIKYTVII